MAGHANWSSESGVVSTGTNTLEEIKALAALAQDTAARVESPLIDYGTESGIEVSTALGNHRYLCKYDIR